jgi:tetratricopeptide (TPR) repeat protein
VLNVALVLSPLAPAIPAFAPAFSRAGSREKLVLAALVLPALAMMLITRPQQGVFRDRDVFAQAGVALSLLAAWGAGRTLAASRARAWLAPALALSTIVPSAHWLAIMHQPDDALRYVHAYITGPPTRTADDRAATYDFIGVRALVTQRYDEAAAAYAKAVEAAPNPRLYATWGVCDIMAGRYPRAESLYRCAVSRDPNFLTGWVGLGTSASWVGDTTTCAEAERQITRLDPGNAQLADLRAYLARVRGAH